MTDRYTGMPPTARERGRLAPCKMGHIALATGRLDEMLDFYCKLLEAQIAFRDASMGFITYDEEHHRIALVCPPGLTDKPPGSYGLDHVSFTYRDLGELLATYRRLKGLGILPFWSINHGPSMSCYYKDPDGNKVELMIDTFATVEEIQAFFAEGAYLENPMGIIFDPEEVMARYEAGEPVADIVKRPRLPEGMTPWDMLRT
ncbi:MAG: VOC family protein [Gammaproteobacteria bacterium]|jgi:catechol 2,3-dioxygenase-like lactoylglutathione lyase family enzyme|nr:VOC family protein [Gammaproteobacteria bacterium]